MIPKEVLITSQDLVDWIDRPPSNDDLDLCNYLENAVKNQVKYKNVIDKIKEYIITRTPSDIGICGNEPKKYYTLNEDEVDYILELLEEVE